MSSLYFANALFSKYQQATANCPALLFTDSPTSPSTSSSASPAGASSCALVSSGYHHHVSSGRGVGALPFPPSSSTTSSSSPSSSSSSSFPSSSSSSSSFRLSLSGLNGSNGDTQPGVHHFNPAQVCTGGAYNNVPGAGQLCSSLQGCAVERYPGESQLCSLAARLPEPACRRQSSPEQRRQLNEERLRIYPWMRSSGEGRGEGGGGEGGLGVEGGGEGLRGIWVELRECVCMRRGGKVRGGDEST